MYIGIYIMRPKRNYGSGPFWKCEGQITEGVREEEDVKLNCISTPKPVLLSKTNLGAVSTLLSKVWARSSHTAFIGNQPEVGVEVAGART